jgi:hypothetical protein
MDALERLRTGRSRNKNADSAVKINISSIRITKIKEEVLHKLLSNVSTEDFIFIR